jgi:hypothetical protein
MSIILLEGTILHNGWDMDNEFIVELKPGNIAVCTSTNHGKLCELSLEDLKAKFDETKNSLNELEEAIRLMEHYK